MINGNLAKYHAFNPKIDYINSMDLEVKVKMAEVLDIITPQVLDTNKLIGIYRQSVVDLNLIRMAILGSFKATNSGSSGQLYFEKSPKESDYALTVKGQQSTSNDEFEATIEYLQAYSTDPEKINGPETPETYPWYVQRRKKDPIC
jgi:hypothetical protein